MRKNFLHPPALSLLLAGTAGAVQAQAPLPFIELGVGAQRIQAEVASTPATHVSGLMQRKALPERQGMLFAHAESGKLCMWMKNTLIPLSVAFIDAQGRILNIEDMQPGTRDLHCASSPAQYALEMNIDWFRANNVGSGDTVRGLENLPGGKK